MLKSLALYVTLLLTGAGLALYAARGCEAPDADDVIQDAAPPAPQCSAQNRRDTRGRSLLDDINRAYHIEGTTDRMIRPGGPNRE